MEENIIEIVPTSDPMVDIIIKNSVNISLEGIEIENRCYNVKRQYIKGKRKQRAIHNNILHKLRYKLSVLCSVAWK